MRAGPAATVVVAVATVAVAACDRDAPMPPPARPLPDDELGVGTPLATLCDLERSAVFFERGSAILLPATRERLDRVAACAAGGPARDRRLVIVGSTGPLGGARRNYRLGLDRAAAVAAYLERHGVPAGRLETRSAGEEGGDRSSYTWALEHRVSIELAP